MAKDKSELEWVRQAMQLPKGAAELFKTAVADRPEGGVKIRGTAAVLVYLSLPEDVRHQIDELVLTRTWAGTEVHPFEVWNLICHIIKNRPELADPKALADAVADEAMRAGDTHVVTRILDPEVTLPPGKKPSDRGGRAGRKSA